MNNNDSDTSLAKERDALQQQVEGYRDKMSAIILFIQTGRFIKRDPEMDRDDLKSMLDRFISCLTLDDELPEEHKYLIMVLIKSERHITLNLWRIE